MTSANSTQPRYLEKLSWYLGHCQHTVWDRFSSEQQRQMVEEDLFAGKSVSLLLLAEIIFGLALCVTAVLTVVFLS